MWLLSPKTERIIFVSVKDNLTGLLAAFASPLLFSDARQAYEVVWWVQPEYRKHRDSIRLFSAYEFWAKEIGCTSIQTSFVHGGNWTDLSEFYERRGYVRTETSYKKVLTDGS